MKTEPPPPRPDEEYTYVILMNGIGSPFLYTVDVYHLGVKIGHKWADSRWGCRRLAKRVVRKHQAMLDPRNPDLIERGTL